MKKFFNDYIKAFQWFINNVWFIATILMLLSGLFDYTTLSIRVLTLCILFILMGIYIKLYYILGFLKTKNNKFYDKGIK